MLIIRSFLKSRRPASRNANQGFALIIALSLMAFILLLLVSMSTLLQVETQAGSTTLAKLRAKEAARLALMVALGDLQKHAGPDQRVTARAEITGTNRNRYWTGVWDTTAPSAPPVWLVSGVAPDPAVARTSVQLQRGYDHLDDGAYDSEYDVPAAQAPQLALENGNIQIAWWVSDQGVKAPIKPIPGVFEELGDMASGPLPDYFDYNEKTLRSAPFLHDKVFDYPELFDATDTTDPIYLGISDAVSKSQVLNLLSRVSSPLREKLTAEFLHSTTLENHFVISNTGEGGLKKDLSYLKTVDPSTITAAQLNSLYADPDKLITKDVVRALYLDGEPIAGNKDTMMGMQIPRGDISAVEAAGQDFSILPIITEFQLSAGIAAEDDPTSPGDMYLVHKLYLELWNPYTLPFVIGKADLPDDSGYSDLRIEISNLPDFSIRNETSGATASGSLPNLSYLLSGDSGEHTMRPGMVFYTTLPRDTGARSGDHQTGTFHTPLGTTLSGENSDGYTGDFTMTGAIEIRIIAINSSGLEKEIYQFELGGYPDFEIHYGSDERATWFKRNRTSKNGQFGMNNESLERPGYAFGFRFKMLDSQNSETMAADLSNWLSLRDPRERSVSIDLKTWDINTAWLDPDTPPYDFRLSGNDFDPGFFEPSESFKSDDFFYYHTGNTGGRRDRIARVFNLATAEPTNLDLLNGIFYPGNRPNPVGNPWGSNINSSYDRYFFSTLPAPAATDSDISSKPLLNSRLKILDASIELSGVGAARGMMLKNGFNINSTSPLAWAKILSGHDFAANELKMQYEQDSYSANPEWFSITEPVAQMFFKFPEAAAFNATELATSPRYEILLREEVAHYDRAFRSDSIDWLADRQHPSFVQCFRELQGDTALELGRAIVGQLLEYQSKTGHPPLSMAEYISSGILQNAIDTTPAINHRTDNFDAIPAFGPTSIDQRTLLNVIGSFSNVRSDSFEITARADITDPASGRALETVMCRAIVQRLPEAHPNPDFGRKLQILRFEWLSPDPH